TPGIARFISTINRSLAYKIAQMAEREGFEPPIGLHLCRISSAVHSTTLPPLQGAKQAVARPESGEVLGEDGGTDKAPVGEKRARDGATAPLPLPVRFGVGSELPPSNTSPTTAV